MNTSMQPSVSFHSKDAMFCPHCATITRCKISAQFSALCNDQFSSDIFVAIADVVVG